MISFKVCLLSIIMLSGYQHSDDNIVVIAKNKKVVIIGKALNCKAGAAVITADDTPYYLDGKEFWNKKFYGKKIKVSEALVIFKLKKSSSPPAQEILEKRVIKKPKWELVK